MKFIGILENSRQDLVEFMLNNKILLGVLLIYVILTLSVIHWGIPSPLHPFTYHMDEWHQLQAVRATYEHFTPNLPGAAHGTMFHFILTGIYLIPFVALGIIDPFAITSSVDSLSVQYRLFEILRINTLIFGVLSIFFIGKIAHDYLKINKNITIVFFTFTPLWLSLSNYFKYDIALILWIILSLFYLLRFIKEPTLKNYLVAGIFCAFAIATKVSAIPLFIIYVSSFFLFLKKKKEKLRFIFFGLLTFFSLLMFLGIPDLILGKGDWSEFIYSNLISVPQDYKNFLLDSGNWWQYLLVKIFPIDFGYGFYAIFSLSVLYWLITFIKQVRSKKISSFKNEFFVLFCLILFMLSLIPLKLGANGNRLLVLLPFFALLAASFLEKLKKMKTKYKIITYSLLFVIFIVQLYQSLIMVYVKIVPDVRQVSSDWLIKNIKKGETIGVENIPIYQMLSDIIVKDLYSKERIPSFPTQFNYKIIDSLSIDIPSIIVIANTEFDQQYFRISQKKLLVERLINEGYKKEIKFNPPRALYIFSGSEFNYLNSGLAPIPTISVFTKNKYGI